MNKLINQKGFTLAEALVAATIFAILSTMVGVTTVNFYRTQHKQKYTNELFEETRFLTERIVREARVNTIDYEEYFSRQTNSSYGVNLHAYEDRFWRFDADSNGNRMTYKGFFNTNANNNESDDRIDESALNDYQQTELYLISSDGLEKVILKRIGNRIDDNNDGNIDDGNGEDTGLESIGIAKLFLDTSTGDETTTRWRPQAEFLGTEGNQSACSSNNANNTWLSQINTCLHFIKITPDTIKITDLKFFISPLEDPRKATWEYGKEINMQPHVTIVLSSQLVEKIARTLIGSAPNVSLQTTVSSRVYNNVIFPEI